MTESIAGEVVCSSRDKAGPDESPGAVLDDIVTGIYTYIRTKVINQHL